MGWNVGSIFFIPRENLTERRLADLFIRLNRLPYTSLPVFEPDNPDAPAMSTVDLSSRYFTVHGWVMEFITSTMAHSWPGIRMIPEHLERLEIAWSKEEVALEKPFDEMFFETFSVIAEEMGAIYAIYGSDYDFEDVESFTDYRSTGREYFFLCDELVEIVGRDVIHDLGRTRQTRNGIAIWLQGPFVGEISTVQNLVWTESMLLRGEPSTRTYEHKGELQRIEDPTYVVDTTPIEASKYREDHTFFILHYPPENHTKDRYTAFFETIQEGKVVEDTSGHPFEEKDPGEAALEMMDHGLVKGYIHQPFVEAEKYGPQGKFVLRVISGASANDPLGETLGRSGFVTILLTTNSLDQAEHVAPFLKALHSLAVNLEPIHGYGATEESGTDFDLRKLVFPETRLWSVNLFGDLERATSLKRAIDGFYANDPEHWMLESCGPNHVLLVNNDLLTTWDGTGDDWVKGLERIASDAGVMQRGLSGSEEEVAGGK